MAASILKIGISQNTNCDNLVGFQKSHHIILYILKYIPSWINTCTHNYIITHAYIYSYIHI